MKVGDLVYMTKSMLEMGYPEIGIVVGITTRCYIVGFSNGIIQPFDSRWVSKEPIKWRNNGRED